MCVVANLLHVNNRTLSCWEYKHWIVVVYVFNADSVLLNVRVLYSQNIITQIISLELIFYYLLEYLYALYFYLVDNNLPALLFDSRPNSREGCQR